LEIIAHRINTIDQLKNLNTKFGVEVDIRTNKNELVIGHDPFSDYISFNDWLMEYKHRTLILNVKEDGLEEILLLKMEHHNIKNFFLLDQGFPYLIKTLNSGEKRCSVRFSDYESINTVISLKGKVDWVWIDFFKKFPLNSKTYEILKNNNFKLCIVSPELQGHADSVCINLRNYIIKNKIAIDAVCTKKLKFWEEC
tara:strand:+ start:406 stop:996 length:591 start_codon:yes stop_codon:yes gene_type:complete